MSRLVEGKVDVYSKHIPIPDLGEVHLRAFGPASSKILAQELREAISSGMHGREIIQVITSAESVVALGVIGRTREEIARQLHQDHGVDTVISKAMTADLADHEKVSITKFWHALWDDEPYAGLLTTPSNPGENTYSLRIAQGR